MPTGIDLVMTFWLAIGHIMDGFLCGIAAAWCWAAALDVMPGGPLEMVFDAIVRLTILGVFWVPAIFLGTLMSWFSLGAFVAALMVSPFVLRSWWLDVGSTWRGWPRQRK